MSFFCEFPKSNNNPFFYLEIICLFSAAFQDFLNANGQFDVGATGSRVLQNCVAYKLCYHRFGELKVKAKCFFCVGTLP